MADAAISGQSGPTPVQASASGKNKAVRKVTAAFEMLLAILQSGGLSGKFLPGMQIDFTGGPSLIAASNGEGEKSGKPALTDMPAHRKTALKSGKDAAEISPEAGKTGTVNLIALFNSGGDSPAGRVAANAAQPDPPSLPKAMAKRAGPAAASAEKPEKMKAGRDNAGKAGQAQAGGMKPGAVEAGAAIMESGVPGGIATEQKARDPKAISVSGIETGKSGRDIAASSRAAPKSAGPENASGLQDPDRETSAKGGPVRIARGNVAAGAEKFSFKLKESAGEGGIKGEGAKAPETQETGNSGRAGRFDSAGVGRVKDPAESPDAKGADMKADKDAPRAEIARPAAQAYPGAGGSQGAAPASDSAPGPGGENFPGDSLSRPVLEQVSGGSIELFRTGGGRVRLSLNPPELGSVDMDLIVDRAGMKLVLASESGHVRSVLQANMDQLRSSLQDQGMNRFDIQIQDRPASDNGGWHTGGNPGRESLNNGSGSGGQFRHDGAPALAQPAAGNSAAAVASGRENINGELSVFA